MLRPSAARQVLFAAALFVGSAFAAMSLAAGSAGTILVGYAPGGAPPAAVASAGELVAMDSALGIAIVRAADAPAALALLRGAPGVDFVELDGAVSAAGARGDLAAADSTRWDASSWDSARWDAAGWDSARWDSSRWDASGWDSSRWDSARWDSSRWDSSRWDSSRWDGSPLVPDPLLGYQWGLADMNVPDAWATTMGDMERTICVVDSGVDATHPDLRDQMWTAPDGTHGWSFVGDRRDTSDGAGHGTHVAGVAAASIGNGHGTAGVANARIMAVKVLNDQGIGGLGTLAQGIKWCADHGAHVISLSLSTEQDSRAVRRAVEHAQSKGALLVASAGNRDGATDAPVYPAAYPGVVGVAALDLSRAPASFSRAGAWVDLAAPGELIAGPLPGEAYALGSGTSQATALVAGAALLVWDHEPELTAAAVAARLAATARDVGAPGFDASTGAGEPDLAAALGAAGDA